MLKIALIGCGAIGQALLAALRGQARLSVVQVIVRDVQGAWPLVQASAPGARVGNTLALQGPDAPTLVVECAGHQALMTHVLPALQAGVAAVVASTGALQDAQVLARLADAATAGGTRLQLVAGAVGGIDALAAARLGGLQRVAYTGRKPPAAWAGTAAEQRCALPTLGAPFVLFEGTARDAARLYPQNANVAATVALAGLGLDATQATLVADPGITRNVHRIEAEGAFGRLDITLENQPLASHPKTSALTVLSLLRAIEQARGGLVV